MHQFDRSIYVLHVSHSQDASTVELAIKQWQYLFFSMPTEIIKVVLQPQRNNIPRVLLD